MYSTYMLKNKFLSFVLFFIITYSASFIGRFATIAFKEPWYSQLIKSNLYRRLLFSKKLNKILSSLACIFFMNISQKFSVII